METNQTVADLYTRTSEDTETITKDEHLLPGVYRGPDGAVYFAGGFDCPDCGCSVVIIRQAEEGQSVEYAECGLCSESPSHAR